MMGRSTFTPRRKRWERITWWYSGIFGVAVVALLLKLIISGDDPVDGVRGVVRDAYSGDPIGGANVATLNATAMTGDDGSFVVSDTTATTVTISREDYASAQVQVADPDSTIAVALIPTTIRGTVTHSRSKEPLEGIEIVATTPGAAEVTTVSDADGNWALEGVATGATITARLEGQTVGTVVLGANADLAFQIRPDVMTGTIRSSDGTPVPGAIVQVGDLTTTSNSDGTFRLVAVPEQGDIEVRKAGFHAATGTVSASLTFDATLEQFSVRALYATALTVGNSVAWPELLNIADTTEINAMVVDLKDSSGQVFFDTQVPLAAQLGAKNVLYDVEAVVAQLKSKNIYSIARIVVFEDPILADARPDLSIMDSTTGSAWTTFNGLAWVNAHEREVWQYNIDLAVEAANLGFDEIQLDYIRFPSDGVLENADYGPEFADETRLQAITGFLERMQTALRPTGALLAIDIFGLTMWDDGDGGIGQNFVAMAPFVDLVCPMIYRCHFNPGDLGLDIPNNHPYDVIKMSLDAGAERVPDAAGKLRPWLQDFSYGEGIEYGDAEVAAQIQASDDAGAHGWMLWSPGNVYHDGALRRE